MRSKFAFLKMVNYESCCYFLTAQNVTSLKYCIRLDRFPYLTHYIKVSKVAQSNSGLFTFGILNHLTFNDFCKKTEFVVFLFFVFYLKQFFWYINSPSNGKNPPRTIITSQVFLRATLVMVALAVPTNGPLYMQ